MSKETDSFKRTGKKAPVKVNVTELKEILRLYTQSETTYAIRIDGYPGIGKSDIVNQIAQELSMHFLDTRLAYKDNVDLAGHMIPNKEEKNAIFLKPEDIPTKENTIWFFDEFNRIMHPTILQTLFQIISNRQCGTHKLPKKVFIVIAGNLGDADNTIVTEFDDSAFDGRTARFLLEPTFEEWLQWADGKINPIITSFLKGNAEYYERLKGRPWAQANETLNLFGEQALEKLKKNDIILRKFLEAIIGSEPLNELFHFAKSFDAINEMDIFLNFKKVQNSLKTEQRERIFQLNEKILKRLNEIDQAGERKGKAKKNAGELIYTDDFTAKHLENLCLYGLSLDADTGAKFISEFFTIYFILGKYTELMKSQALKLTSAQLDELKSRFM